MNQLIRFAAVAALVLLVAGTFSRRVRTAFMLAGAAGAVAALLPVVVKRIRA